MIPTRTVDLRLFVMEATRFQCCDDFPAIWITRPEGSDYWITQTEYKVKGCEHGPLRGRQIIIPDGFEFDLASVPRWGWWLIAPFELSIIAPLVHDYLYRVNGQVSPDFQVSRKEADEIFHDLMILEEVPHWKADLAYRAVRLVSWAFWNKNR